jgi:MFS transporter, FSR family, fosmidomycin resistance protein
MTKAGRPIQWLAAGHFANDFFSGAMGIMLAAQDDVIGLSEPEIGLASGIFLGISITQPFLGWLSDRLSIPHLMILGPLVCALGLAVVGLAPTFAVVLLGAVLGGFGNAMFHPSGLAGARAFGGESRKGSSVAWFMVAGNGAFAISPFIVGFALEAFGPSGILPFVLINLVLVPMIVLRVQTDLRDSLDNTAPKAKPTPGTTATTSPVTRRWYQATAVLISVYLIIVLMRGVIYQALNTFLPTFYKDQGLDLGIAGSATSVIFVFAALGGFVASSLSDRLPRLPIVSLSLFSIAPLTWLLLNADGVWLFALSVPLGVALGAHWPIVLMIGQEVLPGGASGSSGLAFGWGFVANAAGTILVGAIADSVGLQETLQYAALLPLLGAGLVFLLPAQSPSMSDPEASTSSPQSTEARPAT